MIAAFRGILQNFTCNILIRKEISWTQLQKVLYIIRKFLWTVFSRSYVCPFSVSRNWLLFEINLVGHYNGLVIQEAKEKNLFFVNNVISFLYSA